MASVLKRLRSRKKTKQKKAGEFPLYSDAGQTGTGKYVLQRPGRATYGQAFIRDFGGSQNKPTPVDPGGGFAAPGEVAKTPERTINPERPAVPRMPKKDIARGIGRLEIGKGPTIRTEIPGGGGIAKTPSPEGRVVKSRKAMRRGEKKGWFKGLSRGRQNTAIAAAGIGIGLLGGHLLRKRRKPQVTVNTNINRYVYY